MTDNQEFVDGLLIKPPHANAPAFCKARISLKREALIAWLQAREGEWINLDVKESRGGKWYAAVDTWKPQAKASKSAPGATRDPDDDISF